MITDTPQAAPPLLGGLRDAKYPELVQRYVEAQLAGDREAAIRLVVEEGLEKGVSVAELQLDVIQRAQREIGRLWQENRISVAQEHLATAISQLVLAHLYRHLPRPRRNGKGVLLTCVEGESHEMGARLAADFLEMAGFTVRFLGASVPTESLLAMIAKQPPDLVALSVTMTFNLPAARTALERIRAQTGGRIPVLIGGHALSWTPELRDQLRVPATGDDARELVAAAKRILGVP